MSDGVKTCKWCMREIEDFQIDECDPCWEMRSRMERDLDRAQSMLDTLREEQKAWTDYQVSNCARWVECRLRLSEGECLPECIHRVYPNWKKAIDHLMEGEVTGEICFDPDGEMRMENVKIVKTKKGGDS